MKKRSKYDFAFIDKEAKALIRYGDRHGWPIKFGGYPARTAERISQRIQELLLNRYIRKHKGKAALAPKGEGLIPPLFSTTTGD